MMPPLDGEKAMSGRLRLTRNSLHLQPETRPHTRTSIAPGEEAKGPEVYNPLANVTCKIGDASCVQRHALALEHVPVFHPTNPAQKAHAMMQLQQTYGNAFVQRVIQPRAACSQPGVKCEIETQKVVAGVMDTVRLGALHAGASGQSRDPKIPGAWLGRETALRRQPAIQHPLIQLKKIDHRQLTWADFKKRPPRRSRFQAWTYSNFHDPKLGKLASKKALAVLTAVDTKQKCGRGRRKATKFKVNIAVDPQKIEVRPFMWQERSWAKRWTTSRKARVKICKASLVRKCKRAFRKMYAKVRARRRKAVRKCRQSYARKFRKVNKDCKKWRKSCLRAFSKGHTTYGMTVDGEEVAATSKRECKKAFFKECKRLMMKGFAYTLTLDGEEVSAATRAECATKFAKQYEKLARSSLEWTGEKAGETTSASTKADCSKGVLRDCAGPMFQKASEDLLGHEQGHFDITNVMANRAQTVLRNLVATFAKEVTACGKRRAIAKAKASLRKSIRALKRAFRKQVKERRKVQKAYDRETKHGKVVEEQARWTERISEGLQD